MSSSMTVGTFPHCLLGLQSLPWPWLEEGQVLPPSPSWWKAFEIKLPGYFSYNNTGNESSWRLSCCHKPLEISCLWVFSKWYSSGTSSYRWHQLFSKQGTMLCIRRGHMLLPDTQERMPFLSANISCLHQKSQKPRSLFPQIQSISLYCQATVESIAFEANPRGQPYACQLWRPFLCLGNYLCPSLSPLHLPWRNLVAFFSPVRIFEVHIPDSVSQRQSLRSKAKGTEEPRRLATKERAVYFPTAFSELRFIPVLMALRPSYQGGLAHKKLKQSLVPREMGYTEEGIQLSPGR